MSTKSKTKTTKHPIPTSPPEVAESMKAASVLWGVPLPVLRAAKQSGCQAFRGARVFRTPLLAWLKANSDVADQATAVDLEKCTRAELEFARLKAVTRLAISRADQADGLTIPKVDAVSEWGRALGILESEYKAFLEPQEFSVAQRRARLRIANLFGDGLPAQQSDPGEVY